MDGYCQAIEERGIVVDKSLIQISDEENGYELCKRSQKLNYTAVFCSNTIIQFGVLQRLRESGVAVPQEISLIASGWSELVKISTSPLTTIHASVAEKEKTVSMLLDLIHTPVSKNISGFFSEFECFEGGTVAPVNSREKKLDQKQFF